MKTELVKNVEKTEKAKWSGRFPWGSDSKTDNVLKDSFKEEEENTEDSTKTSGD